MADKNPPTFVAPVMGPTYYYDGVQGSEQIGKNAELSNNVGEESLDALVKKQM